MTRCLAVTALASYAAGYALGTLVCHIGWALTTHEHRYRVVRARREHRTVT